MPSLLYNKKASLKYQIIETFPAGMELFGFEVKSLRNKQGSLDGAHVIIRGNEAYFVGALIPPHQANNAPQEYDPRRTRRLLLTKKEISRLAGSEKQKGLTIVPISVYSKGRYLKMEIAVVRGKQKHDKREALKERSAKRDIERTLKNQ